MKKACAKYFGGAGVLSGTLALWHFAVPEAWTWLNGPQVVGLCLASICAFLTYVMLHDLGED